MSGINVDLTVYALASEWKISKIYVMKLIITGKLNATILDDDGNYKTYEKFSDIPDDLRVKLKVIQRNRYTKEVYSELMKPWDQVYITHEEKERFAADNPQNKSQSKQSTKNGIDNPKAIGSLLILVATMAKAGYRYKPTDEKSTAPTEIVQDAIELGLFINEKTVRKWLKEAAELVDGDNWK